MHWFFSAGFHGGGLIVLLAILYGLFRLRPRTPVIGTLSTENEVRGTKAKPGQDKQVYKIVPSLEKNKNKTRGPGGRFTQEEKDAGLKAMNVARCNLAPLKNAAIMPPLVWDNELEKVAQAWADKCTTKHSGGRYGENLAFGHKTLVDAVKAWDSERKNINVAALNNKFTFTADANSQQWCKGGWSNCGHFTQGIWAKTTRVGCAAAYCDSLPYKTVIVCNYDPRGNMQGSNVYDYTAAGSGIASGTETVAACK